MARILTAFVVLIGLALAGAIVSFSSGSTAVGVLLLVVALLASIAVPIVVSIVLVRRARAAATTLASAGGSGGTSVSSNAFDPAATTDRPPSTWLPGPSTKRFTTTTSTTSGDLDPATAEAMVRSLTGMGLDELVQRATSGELIDGVDVDVTRREYTLVDGAVVDDPADGDAIEGSTDDQPSDTASHRSATATVHGVRDTGVDGAAGRMIELDLLVSASGDTPYRVVVVHDLSPADVPRLGQTIWVKVDPSRPAHVELG